MIIPPGKMCAQPATGCNYRPCPSLGVQGGSDAVQQSVQQVDDRLLMICKEKHPNPGNKNTNQYICLKITPVNKKFNDPGIAVRQNKLVGFCNL